VARQFDRSEPAIERAGFVLVTGTAFLLLALSSRAWAEDEPAARAPLPPPPLSAPAQAGERQRADPAPNHSQSDPRPPPIGFHRTKSQLSERQPHLHSASDRSRAAGKKQATLRLASRSIGPGSRRQHHHSVISKGSPGTDRSPAEFGIGHLSPPSDYPDPRLRSTTEAPPEPPQAPSYYPDYFAGPPGYGYAPRYPYSWAPSGPGVFR
jgi:hypothetical protein